ncbi:FAD-dependent tricarballylate dehydrogenase TcuA [Ectothiorhodospira lacustris]|uniref:FAD-dependent tricarballylate dehydrogenase TcuA n=1 Tax=Ectothiorhodospira lacustris TaxID=2899127 RepID=UPI001EE98A7B|nr:FAD-dependent tricarballylate dehydrogenase TcuA [Ectothiorhodospira lacustris]MCG5499285.1 FAD-dependent tricarballylate dehydrogenase TcuA [Ectothiorhodospira lacustris]
MNDVLVIGGGIAAFCAALAARRAGASVQLVDSAPRHLRGGNARHSRNLRLVHDTPSPLFPGRYTAAEFLTDLRRVSGGHMDEDLARLMAERSRELPDWLQAQGVGFQPTSGGMIPWSCKTAFFLGGGKAMINALGRTAEDLGVEILHDTEVLDVQLQAADTHHLPARRGHESLTLSARTVVICSGGYQANPAALSRTWGESAAGFLVRGTPHVRGEILLSLLAQGALPAGVPGACHLVAVNAMAPAADGGIVTRVDGMPWGLVVDRDGRRFQDEGAEITPRRYSFWGRRVARLPGARAHLILDTAGLRRAPPAIYPTRRADTLEGLARALDLNPDILRETVDRYHGALRPDGPEDGHTEGLDPPKTRCALPLNTPPFHAWTMAPGITFTCHGLKVDTRARILMADGEPCDGLYAAGMIMAPSVLGTGYVAGAALTVGAVFGRIAGKEAAHRVLKLHPEAEKCLN